MHGQILTTLGKFFIPLSIPSKSTHEPFLPQQLNLTSHTFNSKSETLTFANLSRTTTLTFAILTFQNSSPSPSHRRQTVSYPPSSLFSVLSRHSLLCSLVALTSRLRSLAHFSLGLARALTISDSSSSLWFVSSPCRTQSPPSLRSLRRWQKKTEPASCPSGGGRLRLLVSAINSVGQLSSPSIPGVCGCADDDEQQWLVQQAEEYAALIMEELDPEETGFIMRLEVMEFSGLKSSSCVTHAINARDSSFFDVVASQLTPKTTG
ncbi:hypothetical protein Ahy_A07g034812 isoform A [Arachis hypogaea]|uniref:Uncharacterized protein n=1 Tax=Arachis hypogaea TaxID=3818 RepID=A0A445CCR3_ARAHY|nr:hypothetical protein Ahy_A07g034812 isoform A [Arachis hypogaea]